MKDKPTNPTPLNKTERQLLYDRIVVSVKDGLARYYEEFPDRLGDARAEDALAWSLRGTQRILKILDEYDCISRKAPP